VVRMVRKQLYIEPTQEVLLKEKSGELGLSEGELVREALSRYLTSVIPEKQGLSNWEGELDFIRQRRALGHVQGERSWRREDAYEGGQDEGSQSG